MLASITPLGERSRGFSWRVTASWFVAGALAAGALAGAVLGALGSALGGRDPSGWRGGVAVTVVVLVLAFDATPLRRRLPSTRRQVNEDWLGRYRGWVYGLAFGAQLGVGMATIVTSAAIYGAFALALLAPSASAGALVGVVFGGVRALSLLPARLAVDPAGLAALHRRLAVLRAPAATVSLVAETAALAIGIGALTW